MFRLFCHKEIEAPISQFCVKRLKTEPLHGAGDGLIGRIKAFFEEPESATKESLDLLWRNVQKFGKGFDDTCFLYCAGAFFQDERMVKRAAKRLYAILDKEWELSPAQMEKLLDCINIGERMAVNGVRLREYAVKMLPMYKDEKLVDYARRLDIISGNYQKK